MKKTIVIYVNRNNIKTIDITRVGFSRHRYPNFTKSSYGRVVRLAKEYGFSKHIGTDQKQLIFTGMYE